MDSMDSKRISPRYAYEARFRISVRRDGEERVFEGRARDVSESGMRAFVGQTLHLEEIAMVTLPIPGLENAPLHAKVSRAVGTEYGFQFLTLSPLQRSHIQGLVENRTPIPTDK